ncbi:MAG TPA: antibiotic biosynthesis monooxygenase [Chthoniobacterales bacterium]|jgi:quinol monooxygenase YgiN|nr:antibiotic biosynthesis monooxygenase [Chthoniobacterales bacterium]
MRHPSNSIVAITAFALFFSAAVQPSKAQQPQEVIVTVIHVDARPADTRSAVALLDGFRRTSLRDPGAKGFEVLQEIGHPNHFTLVEKWLDEKAYEAHNLARHTRHFRDQLQPMLASPFDERIHTELGGVQ